MEKIAKFFENELPNFEGGIVLMFPKSVSPLQITGLLGEDTHIRVFDDMLEVTYSKVKNIRCWEVNELLTILFQDCDFEFLLSVQKQLEAKILIYVVFYHYDKFPALIFDGANMEIIHMLNADISIDPY